jgi:hypothetical protein
MKAILHMVELFRLAIKFSKSGYRPYLNNIRFISLSIYLDKFSKNSNIFKNYILRCAYYGHAANNIDELC